MAPVDTHLTSILLFFRVRCTWWVASLNGDCVLRLDDFREDSSTGFLSLRCWNWSEGVTLNLGFLEVGKLLGMNVSVSIVAVGQFKLQLSCLYNSLVWFRISADEVENSLRSMVCNSGFLKCHSVLDCARLMLQDSHCIG